MSIFLEFLAAGVVNNTGSALTNGVVYIYETETTTLADVFLDESLTIPTSNPITLDSAGRATVWVENRARLVIYDSAGNLIKDLDPVGVVSAETEVLTIVSQQLVPIGSIIPFYDFDRELSFDTTYWSYCDGQTKSINGVSRSLPDLSNRYLVGFGTEGGGDIDSATWATAAVGNASHQADISHTHSVPAHSHKWPNATTGAATGIYDMSTASVLSNGINTDNAARLSRVIGAVVDGDAAFDTASGGSATQTIQPRSIRVRYIMRIK